MSDDRPTTYWDYIRVEDLLALQSGLEPDESGLSNEEVLFITVHQVFELWFKLVLRDLAKARDLFNLDVVAEQELSGAVSRLKRITTIFRAGVHHFDVVETLDTREYLKFRNKLMPASGFQSAQLRQVEILFGLDDGERIPLGAPGTHMEALKNADGSESPAFARVKRQLADRPSLREAIENWLLRTPIDGADYDASGAEEKLSAFIERFLAAHGGEVDASEQRAIALAQGSGEVERLRAMYASERESVRGFLLPSEEQGGMRRARIRAAMLFIETYRDLPLLAWPRQILSSLIELEQSFLLFRQRHARMVERVIGRRTGTGGSSGVDYLDKTALAYRIFRDLWAIRTIMIRPEAAPALEHADFYGFRRDG